MKKEIRTVVYDDELRMEAYRFEGIVQPFPSHFHEHYVIGFVEKGERVLSCRDREYAIEEGSIVLFNPGDSHACVQSDEGRLITGASTFQRRSCSTWRRRSRGNGSFRDFQEMLSAMRGYPATCARCMRWS